MKLKEFFGKDINVNCYIQLWSYTHGSMPLTEAYGNESACFEPWYDMDVVYITIMVGKLIIEVA